MKKSVYLHIFVYFLSICVIAQDEVPLQEGISDLSNRTIENVISAHGNKIEKQVKESVEKSATISENEIQSSGVDVLESLKENINKGSDIYNQQPGFIEATSQNSGVGNEIINSGAPVLVTLTDVEKTLLDQAASKPTQNINPPHTNQTQKIDPPPPPPPQPPTNQTLTKLPPQQKENLTAQEEIPSFSEWTQKQLEEEAEKAKEPLNSTQSTPQPRNTKLRWKNYASLDCGAKVVASNPEAISPHAILSPSNDEYKLNKCTSRIWFIVELCEAIQAKKIDLANFELFSSSPKDFSVLVGDRFPTRDWSPVGQFTAKDERDVQSFDLNPQLFGKYIKVEMKSHYGSEHYCPISLFKVYGTSEFEALEKEDNQHARIEDDTDEEDLDWLVDAEGNKNLFSSATDAVISMVKKAAQVLGNKSNASNDSIDGGAAKYSPLIRICTSPSHLIVCDDCSDLLFGQVYSLLSCEQNYVEKIVQTPFVYAALLESDICAKFGLDFSGTNRNKASRVINAFFSVQFVAAMCNTVAIIENKVVLNSSKSYTNSSANIELDLAIETSELPAINLETLQEVNVSVEATKSNASSDFGRIKPTKTLTTEELVETTTMTTSPAEIVANLTENGDLMEQDGEKEAQEAEIYVSGSGAESNDGLDDHLEHFISEMSAERVTTSATPHAQKESVFLRLSNRIKSLERNMSLSGQYLEELSKRYKKQVEEIQKLLDKTVQGMDEKNRRIDEQNRQLEQQIRILTEAVDLLLAEKTSWTFTITTIIVTTLLTSFLIHFCYNINNGAANNMDTTILEGKSGVKRRKSIDVVVHNKPAKKKQRRPSDQALKIVRCASIEQDREKKRKNVKKKMVGLKRSSSANTLSEESDFQPNGNSSAVWERQKSAPSAMPVDWVEGGKRLEEVPFVLDDSEHSSLEPLSLVQEENKKLSFPNFFKTAVHSRANRVNNGDAITPGGDKKGADNNTTSRSVVKSKVNRVSPTPESKERKSFKKMLKKVF